MHVELVQRPGVVTLFRVRLTHCFSLSGNAMVCKSRHSRTGWPDAGHDASVTPMPQTPVIARINPGTSRGGQGTAVSNTPYVPKACTLAAAAVACACFAGAAGGAEDAGARALQQHQLERQQQQDALQLRMQQQQRATQAPPANARQQQAGKQLEIDQQQRQQELHYRQSIEPSAAQPVDDEGTRRAKAQIELERARQQSQLQLQRLDREMQQEAERRRKVDSRGEITVPQVD